MIDNEIDFTISKIKYAIDNESVWNYLRAIIKHDLLEYEKGKLKYFSEKFSPPILFTFFSFSCLFCDGLMGRK